MGASVATHPGGIDVKLRRSARLAISFLFVAIGVVIAPIGMTPVFAAPAVTFDVRTSRNSLDPSGPRAGDHINEFQYLINEDNTGDPYDAAGDCEADSNGNFPVGFPDDCTWPSIRSFVGGSPVVTQGDQADFGAGGIFANGMGLPPGKYLVSITAEGHKIGGAHFTVPDTSPNFTITVPLDPYPLPLVTLRATVFNDLSTNGQYDVPAEQLGPGEDMSGFTATINDWADEVSTDWYGNPLCTEYEANANGQIVLDANGDPTAIDGTGGKCVSDVNGNIVIPNLGPNRYAMTITPPPDDPAWTQTTTLEGGLDWDIWAMEGYTGYDTEFNVGGESVPWVLFGFVRDRHAAGKPAVPAYYSPAQPGNPGDNKIKGVIARYDAYAPGVGQPPVPGSIWGGFSGGKITGPIERPMLALLDLQDGDRAVWVGEGNDDGGFEITGVRDGEYQLTLWERDLTTMLDLFQVTVRDGQILDTGVLGLTGWFANYHGNIFLDYNENGRREPGEPGVPDFGISLRARENNTLENGQTGATTDGNGYYEFEAAYPFTMWTMMEAYHDRFHTTGVTYQVSNQPSETTIRGSGVDINILPIIGQSVRVDWGVVPYKRGENGSIVGSVFSDTTRNEFDPRLDAVEDWSTGVPGIGVSVYHAVRSGSSWIKGGWIESVTTEQWERPGGCVPRDADGAPVADQLLFPADGPVCPEAPMTGIQVDPMAADGNFGAAVNGNFGFDTLRPGKYIVELTIPNDPLTGRPLYKVEDEMSVNVFAGDVYTPQNTTGGSPSAGGDFDLGNQMDTGRLPVTDPATQAPGAAPICVGQPHLVDILSPGTPGYNPPFADAGGTPYQGQTMPGCEAKLIEVLDGRSVAPAFTLYNDVPLPAHYWGYTVDDLNIDTNPRRTTFGEKRGLSYSPVGIYNWAGRLITQVNADVNGLWEVLLPSTTTMNCPSPSGVCPGMYRFVGNDPGPARAPFRDYNPNYRTIAANFQAWPGVNTVADTAPTQVGASILAPDGQFNSLNACAADPTQPQVFRVNRPHAKVSPGNDADKIRDLVITGDHFGTSGQLRLVDLDTDSVIRVVPTTLWADREIRATIPDDSAWRGAYQLEIVRADGARPINSVTYHIVAANNTNRGYNPVIVEVGPGKPYSTIQDGVDAENANTSRGVVVVVYPNGETPGSGTVQTLVDFSTEGIVNPPGVVGVPIPGVGDAADIYEWNGAAFSRVFDSFVNLATGPIGIFANVDGYHRVDDTHFYLSFAGTTRVYGLPGGFVNQFVADEDVVYYNNGTWQMFFDGSAGGNGLGGLTGTTSFDLDAISVVNGSLYFSTDNNNIPLNAGGTGDDADIYRWNGLGSTPRYTRVVDASTIGVPSNGTGNNNANVDGMAYVDSTHFNVSFSNDATLPVIGTVQDEDVVQYDAGTWSVTFDGTAAGLTNDGQDIDAFDLRTVAVPPPAPSNLDDAYYENVIISSPVNIQGVGTGGVYADGTAVVGSIVHGGDFWASSYNPLDPFNQTEPNADAWYTRLGELTWAGNQNVADGEVFYVLAGDGPNTFRADRVGRVDGLKITGGDQRDFPGTINQIGGQPLPGGEVNLTTQGGGVFLNGYARYFHITNNVFVSNGGAYGGAIRVGSPFSGNNENDAIVIARNRIIANGGSQLAGAISIFNGADNYVIARNDICGNSSTEYGGGVSHYGYSPGGQIHHNRIVLNSAYDEGGGVTIAGELPANPAALSPGAGAVSVRSNMISSNLSNDDGGGLRFLQAGNVRFDVTNNMITNNVSAHQGGGVALNDAPDVRIINNTIAHNLTTATAVTSDGLPAPAGLSTTGHSAQLQATLPPGSATFSNPMLFNNIFSDNRAGTWAGVAGVTGIGHGDDPNPINLWDIGATDGSGSPTVSWSMVDTYQGAIDGGHNVVPAGSNPQFVAPAATEVSVFTWRTFQRFRSAAILSRDVTGRPLGDDHITSSSPAYNAGTVGAEFDIDDDRRPANGAWDMGADEVPGPVTFGPFTAVLDTFTRTNQSAVNTTNINFGLQPPTWGGNVTTASVRIENATPTTNRVLGLVTAGTQTWIGGPVLNNAQEAYVTFPRTSGSPSTAGVFLRATGLNSDNRFQRASSYVEVAYATIAPGVIVRTKRAGTNAPDLRYTINTSFAAGDSLMARINVEGDLEIYRKPGSGAWIQLAVVELGYGTSAWPAQGTPAGGRIGITSTMTVSPGRLDNFGGGEVQ